MNTSYIPWVPFTSSRLLNMLIALINNIVVLSNSLGDILKGILTVTIEGWFYLNKDMYTTLISYDHPRYLGVDLARPHCLVVKATILIACDHGYLKIKNMYLIQGWILLTVDSNGVSIEWSWSVNAILAPVY